MHPMIELMKDLARGAVIGVANVIPGVSGGTMALVLGIYERFIAAIHNLSGRSLLALLDLVKPGVEHRFEKFKHEFDNIDAWFLIKIMIGAGIAILGLARLMSFLLTEYHDPTYGFFWGLVLVSIIAPYNLIKKKTPILLLAGLMGIVAVLAVTGSVSDETLIQRAEAKYERQLKKEQALAETTPDEAAGAVATATQPGLALTVGLNDLVLFLFMGAAAVSAMILPGISGSLLMLIMGGYFEILKAVDDIRGLLYYLLGRGDLPPSMLNSIVLLGLFAVGCGFGLLLFSRLLDYLLHRFHDLTMSFLTGLVIGSLWSIWPFKNTTTVGDSTIYLGNTWPYAFGGNEIATFVMIAIGIVLVGLMIYLEAKFEKSP